MVKINELFAELDGKNVSITKIGLPALKAFMYLFAEPVQQDGAWRLQKRGFEGVKLFETIDSTVPSVKVYEAVTYDRGAKVAADASLTTDAAGTTVDVTVDNGAGFEVNQRVYIPQKDDGTGENVDAVVTAVSGNTLTLKLITVNGKNSGGAGGAFTIYTDQRVVR